MERDFGSEIVRSFSPRLKRIYHIDETDLPDKFQETLQRLEQVEVDRQDQPPHEAAGQ